AAAAGSPIDLARGPRRLLVVREPEDLHALPGPGLHGREHAGALDAGLREVPGAHRPRVDEPAGEKSRALRTRQRCRVHPPRAAPLGQTALVAGLSRQRRLGPPWGAVL